MKLLPTQYLPLAWKRCIAEWERFCNIEHGPVCRSYSGFTDWKQIIILYSMQLVELELWGTLVSHMESVNLTRSVGSQWRLMQQYCAWVKLILGPEQSLNFEWCSLALYTVRHVLRMLLCVRVCRCWCTRSRPGRQHGAAHCREIRTRTAYQHFVAAWCRHSQVSATLSLPLENIMLFWFFYSYFCMLQHVLFMYLFIFMCLSWSLKPYLHSFVTCCLFVRLVILPFSFTFIIISLSCVLFSAFYCFFDTNSIMQWLLYAAVHWICDSLIFNAHL